MRFFESRRYLTTASLLITLALSCACGESEPDTDSSTEPLTCDSLIEGFATYVEANSSCEVVEDCVVVAAAEPCDCAPALGKLSGEAINVEAEAGVEPYIELFDSGECGDISGSYGCDVGPYRNLGCVEGLCVVDEGWEVCLGPE